MNNSRNKFREQLDIEIYRIFKILFMENGNRKKKSISKLDEKSERLVPLIEEGKSVKEMSEEI